MNRLKGKYLGDVRNEMMKIFNTEHHGGSQTGKGGCNMGVGEAKENARLLDAAAHDLSLITGQKPIITRAKKSVASFKVREGWPSVAW